MNHFEGKSGNIQGPRAREWSDFEERKAASKEEVRSCPERTLELEAKIRLENIQITY